MKKGSISSGSTAAILLSLLVLSSIFLSGNSDGQTTTKPMELNRTTVFLSEGMTLSPLDPDDTDEYQAVSIPNGYVRTGLFGYKILPVGGTAWKSVGTWYSQPLKNQINLGGAVEVVIHTFNEDTAEGGSPNAEFRFEFLRGNEVLLSLHVGSTRLVQGSETIITAKGSFPPGNDTVIQPGTQMAFRIMAKTNGAGPVVRFATKEYRSRFTFGTNALQIHDLNLEDDAIILEYRDAFMVPWTKLVTQVELDRVILPGNDMSSMFNSLNSTRQIIWSRQNSPGEYSVMVSLGYNPRENLSLVKTIKLESETSPWFSLSNIGNFVQNNLLLSIFLVAAIIGTFIYARHRSHLWDRRISNLPLEIKTEKRSEAKKAWKERRKERLQSYRSRRKDMIIEDEDDDEIDQEEEKQFELFKKRVLNGEDPTSF